MPINHEYISIRSYSLLTGMRPADIEGQFTVEVGGRHLVPRFMLERHHSDGIAHIELPPEKTEATDEQYTTIAMLDLNTAESQPGLLPAAMKAGETVMLEKDRHTADQPAEVSSSRTSHADSSPDLNKTSDGLRIFSRSELSTLVHPYLRIAARVTDLAWETVLVLLVLLWSLTPDKAPAGAPELTIWALLLLPVVVTPLVLLLDAIAYGVAGNTPGKFMLGLKVVSSKLTALSFSHYVSRNFRFWQNALAYGVLPLCVFYMAKEGIRVRRGFETGYDQRARTRVGQHIDFKSSTAAIRVGLTGLLIVAALVIVSLQIA